MCKDLKHLIYYRFNTVSKHVYDLGTTCVLKTICSVFILYFLWGGFLFVFLTGSCWQGSRLWLLGSWLESLAVLYEGDHSAVGEVAGESASKAV